MGHGFGLPHSNNSDGDSDTYDNPWDNMSDPWRNAVTHPTYGILPKHINIFQRDRLGWVDERNKVTINVGDLLPGQYRDIHLDAAHLPLSHHPQMIVLRTIPPADPFATVLYTLEARVRGGVYESNLAGDAVIIHRVNQTVAYVMDDDSPAATVSNTPGSMFTPGEEWTSEDRYYFVTVTQRTATGFVVRVALPRATGGNLPALAR